MCNCLLHAFFFFLSFFSLSRMAVFWLFVLAFCAYIFIMQWLKKNGKTCFSSCSFILALRCWLFFPFTKYNIGYWFNHGQPPHSSRLSVNDLLNELMGQSQWIKFYLLLIVLLLMAKRLSWKTFFYNKSEMLFLLLTIGILAEAVIFGVTSYTPPDNNIFYHSFAIAFILSVFEKPRYLIFLHGKIFALVIFGVFALVVGDVLEIY